MGRRRAAWGLLLLAAGLMYLFANRPATLILLLYVLLLPLTSILLAALGRRRIRLRLTLPRTGRKGEALSGALTLESGRLPWTPTVGCRLRCRNLRTGETQTLPVTLSARGRRRARQSFSLRSDRCGRLAVEAEEVCTSDLFGLFAFPVTVTVRADALIQPRRFPLSVALSDWEAAGQDRYATRLPGSDPGEVFGIREYAPGDPVRHIHWKLSQKLDVLMVREFGLPAAQRALLVLDTRRQGAPPAVAEGAVELFLSLSAALLEAGQPHQIGWNHPQTGALELRTVECEADLQRNLTALLAAAPDETLSLARCLERAVSPGEYAHVVAVSTLPQPDVRRFCSGTRFTQLLPDPDPGDSPLPAVCFGAGDARVLTRLEV